LTDTLFAEALKMIRVLSGETVACATLPRLNRQTIPFEMKERFMAFFLN